MASYYSQVEEAIKLNEQEIAHLQEELRGLRSVENDTPRESYQRQYDQIMRHMDEEQAKLEGNRNLLSNYELASSSIRKLRELRELRNKERDFQIRDEIDEEIRAREIELNTSINSLTDELADEVRDSFLNQYSNEQKAPETAEQEKIAEQNDTGTAEQEETAANENKSTEIFGTSTSEDPNGSTTGALTDENQSSGASTGNGEATSTTLTASTDLESERKNATLEYEAAQAAHQRAIAEMQRIFTEERTRVENEGPFPTEEQLDAFINDYMSQKIRQNDIITAAQDRMKKAEANLNRINRKINESSDIQKKVAGTGSEKEKDVTQHDTTKKQPQKPEVLALPPKKEVLALPPKSATKTLPPKPITPVVPQKTGATELPPKPTTPALPQKTGATELPPKPITPALPEKTGATELPPKPSTPVVPQKTEESESKPPVTPPKSDETDDKKTPEKTTTPPSKPTKKSLMEIMDGLTKDLNIKQRDNLAYKATNIKVFKEFKDELSSGNYLYNIVHLVPAIIKMPFKALKKFCGQKMATPRAKYVAKELQKRLSLMPEEDLMTIHDQYYKNAAQRNRFPTILNTLIDERMHEFAIERVEKIDQRLGEKYNSAYHAFEVANDADAYIGRNSLTASKEDLEKVYTKRQEAINGQAKNIASIREDYKEAEKLIKNSNLVEDEKAAKTISELSYVSRLVGPESEMDEATSEAKAILEREEKEAIARGNDDKALKKFFALEELAEQAIINNQATINFSEPKSTRRR